MGVGGICDLVLVGVFGLIVLMIPSFASAAGTVEYHQITSKILGDAGEVAERELSVYLPEGYGEPDSSYPTFYLLHGWTGTNRTFLGKGYPQLELVGYIHMDEIMDRLIQDEKVKPMIVVFPDFHTETLERRAYRDYLAQEIAPFVDMTYPTIPAREARAIAGHSLGGRASLVTALSYPDTFSVVVSYSACCGDLLAETSRNHDQELFPLQFWIYVGRNDQKADIPVSNRALVDDLKELSLPHIYVEDDGDHWNKIGQRIEESIQFFSKNFADNIVSVGSPDNIRTVWGQIKARH